jgi:hypothetical protein
MKIWLDLFIGLSKEGEPLPRLKIRVGEDTYEVFDGKPIKDWRPGSMTGHSTSIEVASPPEAEGEAVALLRIWLERLDYSDPHGDKPKVKAYLSSRSEGSK